MLAYLLKKLKYDAIGGPSILDQTIEKTYLICIISFERIKKCHKIPALFYISTYII